MMKKLILLAIILLAVSSAGCRKEPAQAMLPTADYVDMNRYAGRWYEVARYPHRFENGCLDVTADYEMQDDGTIQVVNQCLLAGEGGKIKKALGKAKIVDHLSNAKLKVSFFWPFSGDYWILYVDPDYQHAIVGAPSRKNLWILSRQPQMDPLLLAGLLEKVRGLGYDPSLLILAK
ncbi:MAG: lipocalin family protein [Desulfobulbaceae bacterium]|nr:lipocalin family protein [Desulfobulbaceae bacterium]